MRLILHIGMAKTGTSTLQLALRTNGKLLSRHGILYPAPLFGKSNHNLITSLFHAEESMPREFTSGSRSFEAIRKMGVDFWDDVRQQIRRSDADTVVISGEYFFGLNDARVRQLRELIDGLFDDIQVVAYIRHPADHYLSSLQQQVKASFTFRAPGEVKMSPRNCLRRFLEEFDGSVTARPFERAQLDEGCIVKDFVTRFLPDGPVIAKSIDVVNVNESMSAEAMCILQSLRRYGWPGHNDHFAAESDHVIEVLRATRDRIDQTKAELRPAIRAGLEQKYREDLEWLGATFGVTFTGRPADAALGDIEPDGWMSHDLTEILEIDRSRVERTLYLLLKELAAGNDR